MVGRRYVARAVLPSMGAIAPKVVGAPGAMQWFPDALKESLVGLWEREARVPTVEVQDTYQSGVGL